jgi:hypothetical protein
MDLIGVVVQRLRKSRVLVVKVGEVLRAGVCGVIKLATRM